MLRGLPGGAPHTRLYSVLAFPFGKPRAGLRRRDSQSSQISNPEISNFHLTCSQQVRYNQAMSGGMYPPQNKSVVPKGGTMSLSIDPSVETSIDLTTLSTRADPSLGNSSLRP